MYSHLRQISQHNRLLLAPFWRHVVNTRALTADIPILKTNDIDEWIIDFIYRNPGIAHRTRKPGLRRGESSRFPSVWPGFESHTQHHIWVEFVSGSRPSREVTSFGTLHRSRSQFVVDIIWFWGNGESNYCDTHDLKVKMKKVACVKTGGFVIFRLLPP